MLPDWSLLESIKYTLKYLKPPVQIEKPGSQLGPILLCRPFIQDKRITFTTATYYGISDNKYRVGSMGSNLRLSPDNVILEESYDHTSLYSVSKLFEVYGGWPKICADLIESYITRRGISLKYFFERAHNVKGDFGALVEVIDVEAKYVLELTYGKSV